MIESAEIGQFFFECSKLEIMTSEYYISLT